MIHSWVEKGLLYLVRTDPAVHPQHAVFAGQNVVWVPNGPEGEVQPLLDLEKMHLNQGRAWPPSDPPISL